MNIYKTFGNFISTAMGHNNHDYPRKTWNELENVVTFVSWIQMEHHFKCEQEIIS